MLSDDYYNKAGNSLDLNYQGFILAQNDTVISQRLEVFVTIKPSRLWFQYDCLAPNNGSYSFVFQFPFRITNIIEEFSYQTGYTKDLFSVNNTHSGVIMVANMNGRGGIALRGYFEIADTFYSQNRGSYTIVMPFNYPVRGSEFYEVQGDLNLCPYTSNVPIDLVVGLPSSYEFAQSVPAIDGLDPSNNQSLTTYTWELTQWQTVTLTCNNPNEVKDSEKSLFIGGIVIGVGASLLPTVIYDYCKKKYEE